MTSAGAGSLFGVQTDTRTCDLKTQSRLANTCGTNEPFIKFKRGREGLCFKTQAYEHSSEIDSNL